MAAKSRCTRVSVFFSENRNSRWRTSCYRMRACAVLLLFLLSQCSAFTARATAKQRAVLRNSQLRSFSTFKHQASRAAPLQASAAAQLPSEEADDESSQEQQDSGSSLVYKGPEGAGDGRPAWAPDWAPEWTVNLSPPLQLAVVVGFYLVHMLFLSKNCIALPFQLIPNEYGFFQSIGLDSLAGRPSISLHSIDS
jgi:hypothetical protein